MDEKLELIVKKAIGSINELQKTINWVDRSEDLEDRKHRVDAVAKRFEVSFEYVWKAFKEAAEWQGTDVPGPRPAIQAAAQYGWIDNVDLWAAFLEARNYGVHDYFGLSSEEYFKIAKDYALAAKKALEKIHQVVVQP